MWLIIFTFVGAILTTRGLSTKFWDCKRAHDLLSLLVRPLEVDMPIYQKREDVLQAFFQFSNVVNPVIRDFVSSVQESGILRHARESDDLKNNFKVCVLSFV